MDPQKTLYELKCLQMKKNLRTLLNDSVDAYSRALRLEEYQGVSPESQKWREYAEVSLRLYEEFLKDFNDSEDLSEKVI